MRRKITLVILVAFCGFVAFAQPNAQFSASQLFGCPPLVVNFTDQSTGGATSWIWQFDNGNTSSQQSPTASFALPGIYNVRLIASNGAGSDTATLQIRVFQPAAPNFTAPDRVGCVQPCHTVHFVNQTIPGESPVTQYVWDFGDGSQPTAGFNVDHCFSTTGNFPITLVARDSNGCQTSKIVQNYVSISNGPTANLTASPTQSCTSPLSVSFTGTGSSPNGGVTYAWYFDNGGTSAQQNPTSTYSAGIYDPVLVVSDALGCRDSAVSHVEVIVMQANFKISSNFGCTGIPLQFTDSSNYASTWAWDFGDGTTSNLQNPTHAYAAVGNYTVSLTVTYNGCTGSYTQSTPVNVSVPVTPTFSANDTSDCSTPFAVNFTSTAPGAASYSWTFGDGGTSNLQNPSHTYTANGSFDVSLAVANSAGCVNTLTYTDYISAGGLNAAFSIDSPEGCSPMLVNFTSSSTSDVAITNYQWIFDDGNIGSGAPTSHIYNGGTFLPKLIVTNAEGCVDSATLASPIKVGNALIPDFVADPLVQCVDQPVNFTNNTVGFSINTQWLWMFGDGSTSTLQDPTHAYSDTGFYSITLVAINEGCRNDTTRIDYVEIVVPKADFYFTSTCGSPTTIMFHDTSQGAQTWFWDFGDGTTSTQVSPTHTFPSQNNYTVTLIVTNTQTGCVDSTKKTLPVGRPSAGFTVDTIAGCAAFIARFTDTSAFASSWRWDFGDSTFATTQNPTHIYRNPGIYSVKLVVNPGDPCVDSIVKTNYITVYGVTGLVSVNPRFGCNPLTVSFRDSSTAFMGTVVGWTWTIDAIDTTYTVTVQNFTQVFDTGSYTARVAIEESHGCVLGVGTFNLTVLKPEAAFTNDTIACPGESVVFYNQSQRYTSSIWDFGDGTTSTLDTVSHAFAAAGNYNVSLIVRDQIGCTDTILVMNAIQVDTPVADFYVTTNFSPCPPFPVQFFNSTNRTDLQWLWYFGDGDTSTAYDPLHVYFFPGDYDVTLIAFDSTGCRDTTTYIDMIRVRGPIGHFVSLPDSGCVPLTVQIAGTALSTVSSTLDLGDGTVLNDTFGVSHTYNYLFPDDENVKSVNYYPVYTLTDSVGCTVAYPIDTIVMGRIPYPNLPKDTTVCKGNYVGLRSQFGDHFQWTSSPAPTYLNCDTCKEVLCSAPDTVTLFVVSTTDIGCVARDTVTVNVDKLPPIFPGISFRICPNDTLQLSAGPNVAAATWTPSLYISDTNSVNPKVFPPDSMTYRVTGGNATGCTISRIVKVFVIDKVVADINVEDTLLCQDGIVQLEVRVTESSFNDTVIKWTPGRYLNADNIYNPLASPPPGNYNYQVVVSSSTCTSDTENVHIVIAPNPIVQAGDDQTVTPGTQIQVYASSPDNVSYQWTDVDPMTCTNCRRPFFTATKSQTVYVTVTNQYGCQNVDSVEIKVVSCDPENVYIPNTFTPNNDGLNDLLLVRGIGLRSLDYFRVFDRWGKLVYESKNLNDGWDGKTGSGKDSDEATYVYTVKGVCSNGSTIEKSGNVTLLR